MTRTAFYPLTVENTRRDTRDSVVLTLVPATKHQKLFTFKAGQYLTFREQINGVETRRSYSICAGEDDGHLRVAIKKVDGGAFSSWIQEHVHIGQVLHAMRAQGNFGIEFNGKHRKRYLAIAAGSGITPVLSIIKSALHREPRSSFTLLYGNRASHSIMFREELADIKNQYMARFNLVHVLSREQQDIELFNGRLSADKCNQIFKHWIDIKSMDNVFICGPYEMALELREYLGASGVDKQKIKFELFANEQQGTARPARKTPSQAEQCVVNIALDGHTKTLHMAKGASSILDAALNQGIELPHACKGGVCSTCRAMLVKGEVDMNANFALEDYEIKRGYILCCQSYPVSKEIDLSFDQ